MDAITLKAKHGVQNGLFGIELEFIPFEVYTELLKYRNFNSNIIKTQSGEYTCSEELFGFPEIVKRTKIFNFPIHKLSTFINDLCA